jgi:hypothetical protein
MISSDDPHAAGITRRSPQRYELVTLGLRPWIGWLDTGAALAEGERFETRGERWIVSRVEQVRVASDTITRILALPASTG